MAKIQLRHTHAWRVGYSGGVAIQRRLAGEVVREDDIGAVATVAGIDVGFEHGNTTTRAAVAVLSFPQLDLLTFARHRMPTTMPYIPGLLSFREAPAILACLEKLDELPDILLFDGHGIAHPRRLGIASHVGVLTGLPTIGVGKSRLCGTHEEPGVARGSRADLRDGEETIGAVLRSREGVKPIYVSTGNRVSLETAIRVVSRCLTRFRLPETTRHAHRLASVEPW